MEQNKKSGKPKRFNYVDAILLIVILAIVGVIVYVSVSPIAKQMFEESVEVEYVLQLKGVRREFDKKIKVDDVVVETETLKEIGSVKAVEYRPGKYVGTSADGRTVTSEYPSMFRMYDVTVTVRAKAKSPSGLYEINSYPITAGKSVPFRVPDFIGEAVCISIGEVNS